MMTPTALWLAVAALLPLMALTAWFDLKSLRIPNWLVVCVFGVFVATGISGLPPDVFLWRLAQGAAVLLLGFGIFSAGLIGGGDAKMAAALAPFVAVQDLLGLLVLYAVVALAMVLGLRLVMQLARHAETGWLAVDQYARPARERVFPMGLVFAITIVAYMLAGLAKTVG